MPPLLDKHASAQAERLKRAVLSNPRMQLPASFILSLVLLLVHTTSRSQPTFSADQIAGEIVVFKIALDLHNGRTFCVSKAEKTLLPTPLTRVGWSVPSTVQQLAKSFPCNRDIAFSPEPFTPEEVLSRISGLFAGQVDAATLNSPKFKMAYDAATMATLIQIQAICFKGTPAEKEKLAEFRSKVAAHGYMGNMNTADIQSMLAPITTCKK